ncbi:hypothetical protein [Argonema galeatum]|uniref:hypothetical protein n=1 Tax=Argonema galeatum TaxID=2942762 RepID=UPI0020133246|nr:hypothetical protein [Argonema galeatum]MCL1463105.1 hypothetical protein [Argonema galeatum A003/A1]
MMTANKNSTKKRPATLDKRVSFCNDFPGLYSIQQRNLLYLHLRPRHSSAKYKWQFAFDVLNSGKYENTVLFTKEEFQTLIQLFESKQFDWKNRTLDNFPSFLAYNYLTLNDAVAVANKVAEFTYQLHNDQLRSLYAQEISQAKYDSRSDLTIHIYDDKKGEYQLSASYNFQVEIILFKQGKIKTKYGSEYIGLIDGSRRDEVIATHNPQREDGVLLINHNAQNAEFFLTDWNTFCLQVDRRVFPNK